MIHQPINVDLIKEIAGTLFFGSNFSYYESLISTNLTAKEMIRSGSSIPLIVLGEEQTGGKGRFQRSWHSPIYGGLWLSVAFPAKKEIGSPGHFNYLISVVIARAVKEISGFQVDFKWPNDILLSGKKCCGILSENI